MQVHNAWNIAFKLSAPLGSLQRKAPVSHLVVAQRFIPAETKECESDRNKSSLKRGMLCRSGAGAGRALDTSRSCAPLAGNELKPDARRQRRHLPQPRASSRDKEK
uniref:Uncharacterized protein n=1 Tax=Knipowitschia caucasica TaxID=637954 RepID=A0AAV2L7J9_KNICA